MITLLEACQEENPCLHYSAQYLLYRYNRFIRISIRLIRRVIRLKGPDNRFKTHFQYILLEPRPVNLSRPPAQSPQTSHNLEDALQVGCSPKSLPHPKLLCIFVSIDTMMKTHGITYR